MPGSPTTVTSSGSPEAVTCCSSSCSLSSSPARPTKAVGVILAASRRSPSTRHTSSGSVLPFTFAGGSAEVSKAPSTSRCVVSPITRPSRVASACILEVVPGERIVWTSALGPAYRPNTFADDGCGGFPFTAIHSFADAGNGQTRYTATVMHRNAADAQAHAAMGFHDGWGTCADQLGEVARSLVVSS